MLHAKAAVPPLHDLRLHRHHIPKTRRHKKSRARLHHRNSRQPVGLQYFLLLKSHALEQRVRARIEHLEKPRVVHNSRRIAVSPLHLYLFPILLHLVRPRATASRGVYLTPSRLTKSFFLRPGTSTLSSCRSSMASSTLHPSNRSSRTRLPSSSCSISNPPSPAPNPKPASSQPPPAPSSPPIVAPNFS